MCNDLLLLLTVWLALTFKYMSILIPLPQPGTTKMFINGQFVESKTDKWIDLHNPVSYMYMCELCTYVVPKYVCACGAYVRMCMQCLCMCIVSTLYTGDQ